MKADHTSVAQVFRETRGRWPLMTTYERFEQIVALVLSLIIVVVIVIALVQLVLRVLPLVIGGAVDILDHEVFQALGGRAVLAMKFATEACACPQQENDLPHSFARSQRPARARRSCRGV